MQLTTRVGVREFRENLTSYLESPKPVAITRHGETIGIYFPTRHKPGEADLQALRAAGAKMQSLIADAGLAEDEILSGIKELRSQSRKSKG